MLCRAVVDGALRKIGRLASGREARPVDAQDTLDALKGLYQSWIASGAFGRLRDVIPTADYIAGEDERVFRNVSATLAITLPETVADCWGDPCDYGSRWTPPGNPLNRDARPPRDGAVVVIVDAFTTEMLTFIYSGTVKRWEGIDGLTLDSEAPMSAADPEGLRACLALEVADLFGAEIPVMTMRQASRFQTAMTSRFSMPRREAIGDYV